MAPYEETADEDTIHDSKAKKIEFRFCKECANMLYPREDRTLGTLLFQCRNCQFTEEVGPVCIYRNDLSNTVGETSGVTQDVASDPTVGDPGLVTPDICTLCGHEILCPTCGEPTDGGTCLEVIEGDESPDHQQDRNSHDCEHEDSFMAEDEYTVVGTEC